MTKKFVKAALIASCALVLMVATIAGTIAYLTSTATIQNTFTSGKVAITMDEAKVNENGKAPDKTIRVTGTTGENAEAANSYKLLPGKTYDKDPIIHVEAGSERCFIFVKVVNEIKNIEDTEKTNGTIVAQLDAKWTQLSENGNESIWFYDEIIDARNSESAIDVHTFETFTVSPELENLTEYERKTIKVTAYAVQADADGFDTAAKAWAATFGAPANQ